MLQTFSQSGLDLDFILVSTPLGSHGATSISYGITHEYGVVFLIPGQ